MLSQTFADARALFDIPREVAYLNMAYMSPLLHEAVAEGERAVARKARPWTISSNDFFTEAERGRRLLGALIGASAEDVAIVPAASYGIAVAAANLPCLAGQTIVTLAEQFPSNVYSWRALAEERGAGVVAAEAGPDGDLTTAVLAAIDERCAIAALPEVRWTDGRRLDLEAVGKRCRAVGAALVLDLTQSLGALPFDVRRVQPDFMVAAGYKWLMGPYSLSWLYVSPAWRDGRPLEQTWLGRQGSEDFSRLIDYRSEYAEGARRFDMGERANFVALPMAIVGLEHLLAWQERGLADHLASLTADIATALAPLGVEALPAHLRGANYLGLKLPAGTPPDLLPRLAARDVHVSRRGDRLRVTPHIYNDAEDIERLRSALAAILDRGHGE